jgi:hypothetical protein
MSKQLSMCDLDLSFVPGVARKDLLWQQSINLAMQSGSENHNLSVALMSEDAGGVLDLSAALQNALNNAQILKDRGISKRQFRQEISL